MAKLELALLVGEQSKGFLASLTQQIDRLEALAGKIGNGATGVTAGDDSDEEELAPAPKKNTKKAAASFDEEDAEVETEAAADDEDESFEAPPKKAAKAKKLTVEDVNAACKARAARTDFKSTKALLKKTFKVDSVQDLKPEQYAKVIAAMQEDEE